jgi:putative DNA primase/helicase
MRAAVVPTQRTARSVASLGPVAGGAVQLAQVRAGQWLLVAEGLETTLSVMRACALPGWAALSAGGIKSLLLPPSANMVVICADNDANGVGQRAANAAAERFLAEGRRVRIAVPPVPGVDFNDLLRRDASVRDDEHSYVA